MSRSLVIWSVQKDPVRKVTGSVLIKFVKVSLGKLRDIIFVTTGRPQT